MFITWHRRHKYNITTVITKQGHHRGGLSRLGDVYLGIRAKWTNRLNGLCGIGVHTVVFIMLKLGGGLRIEKVGDLLLVSIKCGFMKYSILLIIMICQWHVSALA
jgi:hypothetical protein